MRRILTALLCLLAVNTSAETLEGRVVGISDGDSLTVLTSIKLEVKVRLKDIDAPERGQPYRAKAKQALSDLVYGKTITVSYEKRDRYGRLLGKIKVDGVDVSESLVRMGAAWVYREYSQDTRLLALEADARAARRGLWARADPIPPWDWRRGEKAPEGCRIKGNISKNGKLYHMPGDPSYKQTKINTKKGERWFCSAAEAEAAGWRRAHRR